MSPPGWLAWLAGAVLTLILATVTGMVSDEARARLDRIPYGLLRVAIRRLPQEIRADVGQEWRAELDHILHRVQAYPLTRLLSGTRFALGLLRVAPAVGKSLIGIRTDNPEGERPHKSASRRDAAERVKLGEIVDSPPIQVWRRRLTLAVVSGLTFTFIFTWRACLTGAILAAIADAIYRSRTMVAAPPGASARAMRLLSRLRPDQYICLHNLAMPGTREEIDHLVVGPGGIYILTSQEWDRRLSARAKPAEGQLYHGPASKAAILEDTHRRAASAAELIGAELGAKIEIRAGVLILGPRLFHNAVPATDVIELRGVDVFGPRATRRWLEHGEGTVPAAEREKLAAAVGRVFRQRPTVTAAPESETTPGGTS